MLIVDRIEGDFAVVECGNAIFNIPLTELPEDVAEGDCLKLTVNREQTDERARNIEKLMKKITQK